ncbi:MAG: hypothetical protein MHM6MM_007592 [Cercozoa sp. M6MM]
MTQGADKKGFDYRTLRFPLRDTVALAVTAPLLVPVSVHCGAHVSLGCLSLYNHAPAYTFLFGMTATVAAYFAQRSISQLRRVLCQRYELQTDTWKVAFATAFCRWSVLGVLTGAVLAQGVLTAAFGFVKYVVLPEIRRTLRRPLLVAKSVQSVIQGEDTVGHAAATVLLDFVGAPFRFIAEVLKFLFETPAASSSSSDSGSAAPVLHSVRGARKRLKRRHRRRAARAGAGRSGETEHSGSVSASHPE